MAAPNLFWRFIVLAILALTTFYYVFPTLYRFGDYVRQTSSFSGQGVVEQEFTPTRDELACLHGGSGVPHAAAAPSPPMPNIVHFIFLQKLPLRSRGGDFAFIHYLAVRSAIVALKPDGIFLHYGYISSDASLIESAKDEQVLQRNSWIKRLRPFIKLTPYRKPLNHSLKHSAHLADTMRLELLLADGGIYMDIDAFALRPFGKALSPPAPHDVVLGHEGGNRAGLCNAVIAARPNSTFIQRWLDSYATADLNTEWNYHSVILPKELATEHSKEVCQLAPDAFFWPTWTWRHITWMHEALDPAEAAFWKDRIEDTGGSLFDNQLTYHAWSQMAADRYLKHLTPERIRREDTRFNLLVRRFLESDI